jgi:uncharacterized membrane protein
MGTLSQAKTLGGVGSILMLLNAIPSVGPVMGIAGFILVLIAVKYISDSVGDKSIFNNMIFSVITGIVAIVAAAILVFASLLRFIGLEGFSSDFFNQDFVSPSEVVSGDVIGLIASIVIGLVVFWILFVISAIFLRKSFTSISQALNVGMFGTASMIYLIGAALTIILVGFVLIFVAQILYIVAFFSIPDKAPESL